MEHPTGFFWVDVGDNPQSLCWFWVQGWLGAGCSLRVPVNNFTFVTPEIAANNDSAERWPALNFQKKKKFLKFLPKSRYLLCWAWCVIPAKFQGLGVRLSGKGGGDVSHFLNLLQILLCKPCPPQAPSFSDSKFLSFCSMALKLSRTWCSRQSCAANQLLSSFTKTF